MTNEEIRMTNDQVGFLLVICNSDFGLRSAAQPQPILHPRPLPRRRPLRAFDDEREDDDEDERLIVRTETTAAQNSSKRPDNNNVTYYYV